MEGIQLHSIIFSCTKKVTFWQVLFQSSLGSSTILVSQDPMIWLICVWIPFFFHCCRGIRAIIFITFVPCHPEWNFLLIFVGRRGMNTHVTSLTKALPKPQTALLRYGTVYWYLVSETWLKEENPLCNVLSICTVESKTVTLTTWLILEHFMEPIANDPSRIPVS